MFSGSWFHRATNDCAIVLGAAGPRCFRGLRLVHQEGEAGRDLMRLLADLISHLRNLLVAKADPRALEQELSAEAVAS